MSYLVRRISVEYGTLWEETFPSYRDARDRVAEVLWNAKKEGMTVYRAGIYKYCNAYRMESPAEDVSMLSLQDGSIVIKAFEDYACGRCGEKYEERHDAEQCCSYDGDFAGDNL